MQNPYNLFETQANQVANSFSGGPIMAEFLPGWGNNPAYQTPAYDAPYRPQYQGPNPYQAYQRPGFLGGLNNIFNPLMPDPYWGNPVEHMQSSAQAVGSAGPDAAMWLGQRVAAPALAYGLASAGLGKAAGRMGENFAHGVLGSFGLRGGAASAVAKGVGWMSGMALPYVAADAALSVAEHVTFQPYLRSRQLGETVQDVTRGFSYGGGYGNPISGRGLSGAQSTHIGGMLDRQGMGDMTFSAEQFQGIAGMAGRAGLFNNSSPADISKKMKDVASQIKMILAISRDPSVQSAIEELGKLQTSGASLKGGVMSQAGRAYSGLGMMASAGATTTQYLMNTVGAQGQYMYQMNGLTPYLGQMAAASTYAGLSSAWRSGLINPSLMARMGGLEGATQSSMSGMVAAARTPFAQMQGFNQYMLGGNNSSVSSTVSSFGAASAGNAFSMTGNMALYGGAVASRMLKDKGSKIAEDQALQYLQSIGQRPEGPGGKYSAGQIASVLKQAMGWSDEQIQAYAAQRAGETDVASTNLRVAGIRAQTVENDLSIRSQEGVAGTAVNAVWQNTRRTVNKASQRLSNPARGVAEWAGELTDSILGFASDFTQGERISGDAMNKAVGDQGYRLDLGTTKRGRKMKGALQAGMQGLPSGVYEALNEASDKGGPQGELAQKLLSGEVTGLEAKRTLRRFIEGSNDSELQAVYSAMSDSPKFTEDILANIKKFSVKSTGGKIDLNYDALTEAGEASQLRREVGAEGDDLGVVLKDLLPKYKHLSKSLAGKSTAEQVEYIRNVTRSNIESGLGGAGELAANTGMSLDEIAKNPASFTTDKALQAKIRSASGNRSELNRLVLAETSRRNGGILALGGRRIKGELTDDAFAKLSANQASFAEQMGKTTSEGGSNVDWKGFTDVSNKLDNAGAKLLEAANLLKQAAGVRGAFSPGSGQRQVGGGSDYAR